MSGLALLLLALDGPVPLGNQFFVGMTQAEVDRLNPAKRVDLGAGCAAVLHPLYSQGHLDSVVLVVPPGPRPTGSESDPKRDCKYVLRAVTGNTFGRPVKQVYVGPIGSSRGWQNYTFISGCTVAELRWHDDEAKEDWVKFRAADDEEFNLRNRKTGIVEPLICSK